MRLARFTEERIIAVLKEHDAGAKTVDLARKHDFGSDALQLEVEVQAVWTSSEAKRVKTPDHSRRNDPVSDSGAAPIRISHKFASECRHVRTNTICGFKSCVSLNGAAFAHWKKKFVEAACLAATSSLQFDPDLRREMEKFCKSLEIGMLLDLVFHP